MEDVESREHDPEKRASLDINNPPTLTKDTTVPVAVTPTRPLFPETDLDQGIVGWDGQDDPDNPQNFASARKWGLLALISSITFISPLASSMFSPAVSYVGKDFGVTNEYLLSFSVTIFLLGYTVSWKRNLSVCQLYSISNTVTQ